MSESSIVDNFFTFMEKLVGVDEPENDADLYERGKKIVPECVETNDNEKPIKQYDNFAILRTRLKFMRAEGRLQVTNQRILFRATGRSLIGRTALQHSFALQDIAGVEARKDNRFSVLSLLGGLLVSFIISSIFGAVGMMFFDNGASAGALFALVVGIGGIAPFFVMKKQFFVKMVGCAASLGSLLVAGLYYSLMGLVGSAMGSMFGGLGGMGSSDFMGTIVSLLTAVSFAVWVLALILFSIKPNFVFVVKTKGASGAVEIRRKNRKEEYTGFDDVITGKDAGRAIKEVNAMILDFQTKGIHSLDRWVEDGAKTAPIAPPVRNVQPQQQDNGW